MAALNPKQQIPATCSGAGGLLPAMLRVEEVSLSYEGSCSLQQMPGGSEIAARSESRSPDEGSNHLLTHAVAADYNRLHG
jgi:hypothetical protein